MKNTCLVCKGHFDGNVCPIDGFPVIYIGAGAGTEELMAQLQPTINARRAAFLPTVEVGVTLHYRKEEDGKYVLDHKEEKVAATADKLLAKEQTLAVELGRDPEAKEVSFPVFVRTPKIRREFTAKVPNLTEAQTQHLELKLTEDMAVQLRLTNAAGKGGWSEPFALFD